MPPRGAVAQLGERYVRIVEVEGSIPFRSTIFPGVLAAARGNASPEERHMSRFGTLLLVVALVGAAFFLGTRVRQPAPAAGPQAPAPTAEQTAEIERKSSAQPSAQPPRTFLGPDGRAHLISYDSANPPDSSDPEQVREGLLQDMRNHPRNIQRSYDIPLADIQAILAGKRPVPPEWLPPPRKPAPPAAGTN